MDPRQADYYLDALYFLDIVDEDYNYREVAMSIKAADTEEKTRHLRNLIVNRPVFKSVYRNIMAEGVWPDKKTINRLIQHYFDLNDTTAERRTETVVKWLEWIEDKELLTTAHYYE